MTNSDEPKRTNRKAAAGRARIRQPASRRLHEQAGEVTKDLQKMAHIAGDAVDENLEQFRENASEYYEYGRDQVHKVERSFEQYIRDQPLKSIFIAAGIGLLLGRFWMRR